VNYVLRGKFFKEKFDLLLFLFTSRGSPMVIGVKCADQLATNHIPVMFSKGKNSYRFNSLLKELSLSLNKIPLS
jgi:hypothetical protein